MHKGDKARDKKKFALIHDVGLIAGVDYLRNQEKYFILSQETSVNNYAKAKPSINDLPISIRLETLINILAVDSGGIEIDASDYATLFASMIRKGLVPNRDVFKLEDLSLMLEKNEQIAHLPEEDTVRIAKDFHRKRLLGTNEEKMGLELSRAIQGVKIKVVDELAEKNVELSSEKAEKNRYKAQADVSTAALRKIVEKDYDKKVRNQKILFYGLLPLIFIVLGIVGFYIYKNNVESTNFIDYLISIFIEVVISILFICFSAIPRIRKLQKERNENIEKEIEKKLI